MPCQSIIQWKKAKVQQTYDMEGKNGKGDMQGDNLDMDGRPENNVWQTES